jgi:hypothetical protein
MAVRRLFLIVCGGEARAAPKPGTPRKPLALTHCDMAEAAPFRNKRFDTGASNQHEKGPSVAAGGP